VSPQNTSEQKGKNVKHKKLSRAKLDSLRAEGKCFNCQQTGHKQRNCLRLNSMRPPKPFIKAGAINLSKMDRMAKQSERADVYFGHISMTETDLITEELRELEELEYRVHRMCEEAWGKDPAWYNEETRLNC